MKLSGEGCHHYLLWIGVILVFFVRNAIFIMSPVWFAGKGWPPREDCILETKRDGTEHLRLPQRWGLWRMHSSLSVSWSAEIHSLPLQTAQWCVSLCGGLALPAAAESACGKPGQTERPSPQTGLNERLVLCFSHQSEWNRKVSGHQSHPIV